MPANRIVAVLTPLLFAPAAGAICAYLAEHFPGVQVDEGSLQQVFVAGAAIALVPAAQWLHGWQKHEARLAESEQAIALAGTAAPEVAAGGEPDIGTENGGGDLEADGDLGELADLDGFDGDDFAELDAANAPAED
jgi:hypothetical protein